MGKVEETAPGTMTGEAGAKPAPELKTKPKPKPEPEPTSEPKTKRRPAASRAKREAPELNAIGRVVRTGGWTEAKRETFLAHLAVTANVSASARLVGMGEPGAYKLRRRDADFRAAWKAALEEGLEHLEQVALQRALGGTLTPIIHGGEAKGEVLVPDNRMVMFLLRMHRETARMMLELKLAGLPLAGAGRSAVAGDGVREPDAPHGPTVVALLDLPPLDATAASVPRIWAAAAGPLPGWRRAELGWSIDGGATWQDAGQTAMPAVMGVAETILPPGSSVLMDRTSFVDVALLHDGMVLIGRDDEALVNGANVAMIGDELIQFGSAAPLGGGRYRLSRLMRGRRGTEAAMAGHAAGERFVLIETPSLLPIELPASSIGGHIGLMARGVGDGAPATAQAAFLGRALRPPSPAHLRLERGADGGVLIGWTRRSRTGWPWIDGADAPLAEEAERYRIVITPAIGSVRTAETSEPAYAYDAARMAADGAAGTPAINIAVHQIGAGGLSDPATASMTF
ncbi:GTA baseplate fiber-binding domain-containing protein [Edaphosphingomonas haloaromaticamans]|uniref:Rcc01698-like C-terminal domain-containing protein n=1 Tax=Edaphosphingomonas haloaromaticamans TaxID=653954 RepID=A0A1S1HGM8_9SPHN|nr:hypothetical protein [Sphingomonas haloaromaticamans]OHT19680.1 hypothetical protein BHE75_01668 [Sphingomonas haloaromaticamans]